MSDPQPHPDAEIVPLALDDRLKRLEAAIAGVQSRAMVAHATEDELAERVLSVLTAKAAEHRAANGAGPPGLMPTAAVTTIPPEVGALPNGQTLWGWFVAGIFSEVKTIARMYFDPRYRVSRVGQFGVPAVLALFVLNYFFFAYTCALPVVPLIGERIVCVILSLALYKVLVREVARYRQVLAYLAQYS